MIQRWVPHSTKEEGIAWSPTMPLSFDPTTTTWIQKSGYHMMATWSILLPTQPMQSFITRAHMHLPLFSHTHHNYLPPSGPHIPGLVIAFFLLHTRFKKLQVLGVHFLYSKGFYQKNKKNKEEDYVVKRDCSDFFMYCTILLFGIIFYFLFFLEKDKMN